MYSYHDVVVYVGNKKYVPSQNYALLLHCTKAGGWSLWNTWDKKEVLIGEEFGKEPFCIEVAGMIICGNKPAEITEPDPFGWKGTVDNTNGKITFK